MPNFVSRIRRLRRWRLRAVLFASLCMSGGCSSASAPESPPLVLAGTIVMPGVAGRIDHLALDSGRNLLFVAALGSGALERIDLNSGRAAGRVGGLPEPQGVGVIPALDEVIVACGGDGSVRFFREDDLAPLGVISLGSDADDVRVDRQAQRVFVGFGNGGLAVIDARSRSAVGRIALPAHPEGFALDGGRAYVNLPDAGEIGVADLALGRLIATWPNHGRRSNFPLNVDPKGGEVAAVYRLPARLLLLDARTGGERAALPACGDADDVYFDGRRARWYVICGDGHVDVFSRTEATLTRLASIDTLPGSRTGLFDPASDRLYVASRAGSGRPAAIRIYRPQ
jgi:DNA-binding beta-propeller fold protein YncE